MVRRYRHDGYLRPRGRNRPRVPSHDLRRRSWLGGPDAENDVDGDDGVSPPGILTVLDSQTSHKFSERIENYAELCGRICQRV
jgi:hypothetical protein